MNKLYTAALFVILACLSISMSAQQTILSQDFEGNGLPAGWMLDQNPQSVGWEFGTANALSSQYFPVTAHTKFACSNDDANDASGGNTNIADRDRLITPVMDLTSYSAVTLKFQAFFQDQYGSSASIEASTDNGLTWQNVTAVNATNGWEDVVVDLSLYKQYSSIRFAFRHNDGGAGSWADGFAIDDVEFYEPAALDAAVTATNFSGYVVRGVKTLNFSVTNAGLTTITSLDLSYSLDNGLSWTSDVATGLNIAPGASTTVSYPTQISLWDSKEYEVLVKVENPNGSTDANASNNIHSTVMNLMVGNATKNTVLEEWTGAWCQYCPDGAYLLNTLTDDYTDFIGVALHAGDAMETSETGTLDGSIGPSFPAAMVDRVLFSDQTSIAYSSRAIWEAKFLERREAVTPVKLEATTTYNSSNRELTVTVTAQFLTESSQNFRLNAYVVEDSVTGTGSGYNQVNYYNSVSGHPYQGAGNPIIGYVHMHVLRTMLGGPWGQVNSIPSPIATDTAYTYTFTTTLPVGWKEDDIQVVALLQEYGSGVNNRPILNALELGLNDSDEHTLNAVVGLDVISEVDPTAPTATDGSIEVVGLGTAPFTYNWSTGGTTPAITGLGNGTYTVTVTDYFGGTATRTFNLGTVGISQVQDEVELSVYPNPTNGLVNVSVKLNTANDVTLEVMNALGAVVNTTSLGNTSGTQHQLDLGDLPTGVYFVKVSAGSAVSVERITLSK